MKNKQTTDAVLKAKRPEKMILAPRRVVREALTEALINLDWAREPQYVAMYSRQVRQLRSALDGGKK